MIAQQISLLIMSYSYELGGFYGKEKDEKKRAKLAIKDTKASRWIEEKAFKQTNKGWQKTYKVKVQSYIGAVPDKRLA
ncbi:TPA: hypothetical protein RQK49_001169 [Vibrio vulnificus]|nr:hypothetical protein [Vibrio vulnificus]